VNGNKQISRKKAQDAQKKWSLVFAPFALFAAHEFRLS
jgi:hypothetical protein